MRRLDYHRSHVQGLTLNVGCQVDPGYLWQMEGVVNLDIDRYDFPLFVQAEAHILPFMDGTFDVVILGDISEHTDRHEELYREAYRCVKLGGKLVITIPFEAVNPETDHSREDLGQYLTQFGHFMEFHPFDYERRQSHQEEWTAERLVEILDKLGYRYEEHYLDSGPPPGYGVAITKVDGGDVKLNNRLPSQT